MFILKICFSSTFVCPLGELFACRLTHGSDRLGLPAVVSWWACNLHFNRCYHMVDVVMCNSTFIRRKGSNFCRSQVLALWNLTQIIYYKITSSLDCYLHFAVVLFNWDKLILSLLIESFSFWRQNYKNEAVTKKVVGHSLVWYCLSRWLGNDILAIFGPVGQCHVAWAQELIVESKCSA